MSCGHPCACVTYGAHLRAKNIRLGDIKPYSQQRSWDRELGEYAAARRQGVQPATTKLRDIRAAMAESERTGAAYDAGNPG